MRLIKKLGFYGRPPYYGGGLGPYGPGGIGPGGIGAGGISPVGFGGGPLPFGSEIPFNSRSGTDIEAEEPEEKSEKEKKA